MAHKFMCFRRTDLSQGYNLLVNQKRNCGQILNKYRWQCLILLNDSDMSDRYLTKDIEHCAVTDNKEIDVCITISEFSLHCVQLK